MLAEYPEEELLRAPYLYERFEAELIRNYLNQLTPENMLIGRYSNELETDSIEPRYQIDYQITEISDELKALWGSAGLIDELSIKPLNPYVANNFELLPIQTSDSSIPELIVENSLISSWYLQDKQFKQPRGGINLAILSPNAINSAKASVANKVLTAMLNEQLNEPLYDAALAGLGAELYSHMRGLSIKVSGYSEKLDALMERVVNELDSPLNDLALFERLKRATKEELSNSLKDKPYNRTFAALYQELLPGWSVEDQLSALEHLTLSEVIVQRDSLLREGELRLFTHGNLTKEQAKSLTNKVINAFASMKPLKVERLSAKIVPDANLTVQTPVKHTDNALLLYLQSDEESSRAEAEVILLNEILSTPFYTQLRTEQQLGYIVFSNYLPIADRPGIALVVQSPTANIEALQTAYKQFIAQWRQQLPIRLDAEIEDFKASVRARIASPSKRLSEETARLWREIDRDNGQFDSKEQLLKAIEQVGSEDLIRRIDQLLNHKLWITTVSA
jgi:secreted Zn-dependent insulinase-like peptidase